MKNELDNELLIACVNSKNPDLNAYALKVLLQREEKREEKREEHEKFVEINKIEVNKYEDDGADYVPEKEHVPTELEELREYERGVMDRKIRSGEMESPVISQQKMSWLEKLVGFRI